MVRQRAPNETVGQHDVRSLLAEHLGPLIQPTDQTVRNYTAHAMSQCESTTDHAAHQTEAQLTAENSLIAAATLAVQVCAAHILPGPSPTGKPRPKDNLALKLMEETFGVEHHCVHETLVFNTDDTALQVFEGTTPLTNCNKTLGVPGAHATSTQAAYKKNGAPPSTYVNLHMTVTTNGGGFSTPKVCRLKCKEREFRDKFGTDGLFVMKVPSVAAGADIDPTCDRPAYIVFMRSTASTLRIRLRATAAGDGTSVANVMLTWCGSR